MTTSHLRSLCKLLGLKSVVRMPGVDKINKTESVFRTGSIIAIDIIFYAARGLPDRPCEKSLFPVNPRLPRRDIFPRTTPFPSTHWLTGSKRYWRAVKCDVNCQPTPENAGRRWTSQGSRSSPPSSLYRRNRRVNEWKRERIKTSIRGIGANGRESSPSAWFCTSQETAIMSHYYSIKRLRAAMLSLITLQRWLKRAEKKSWIQTFVLLCRNLIYMTGKNVCEDLFSWEKLRIQFVFFL